MVDTKPTAPSLEPLKGRAQRRREEKEARKAALALTPEQIFGRVANTCLRQFQELARSHEKGAEIFDHAENELVAGFLIRYLVVFGQLKGNRAQLDEFGKLIAGAVHAARQEFDEKRIVTLT